MPQCPFLYPYTSGLSLDPLVHNMSHIPISRSIIEQYTSQWYIVHTFSKSFCQEVHIYVVAHTSITYKKDSGIVMHWNIWSFSFLKVTKTTCNSLANHIPNAFYLRVKIRVAKDVIKALARVFERGHRFNIFALAMYRCGKQVFGCLVLTLMCLVFPTFTNYRLVFANILNNVK